MTAPRKPKPSAPHGPAVHRPRARELGIAVGSLPSGPLDAITDVPGVRVGHATLIAGEGALRVGQGPVRTGVTVVLAHEGNVWAEPVFAAPHRLNGNGEMTGLEWIREAGLLASPIALTNTHSVGIVHDALLADRLRRYPNATSAWDLPVVAETWDGRLNDIDGFHVRPEHVTAALDAAVSGPIAEGGVGGGTGMVAFGFKGGIGTSSRVVTVAGSVAGRPREERYTVGVLVQANFGRRARLAVNGVPVGRAIGPEEVPLPVTPGLPAPGSARPTPPLPSASVAGGEGAGSVIVLVATDAPLLPHQLARVAQRAGLGIARLGGTGETTSGDLFLAFATGNRGLRAPAIGTAAPPTLGLRMVADHHLDPFFDAAVEGTEAAVLNALLAAATMTGRDGVTAHAIPADRLVELLAGS